MAKKPSKKKTSKRQPSKPAHTCYFKPLNQPGRVVEIQTLDDIYQVLTASSLDHLVLELEIPLTIWVAATGDIRDSNLNFTTRTHTYGSFSGIEAYGFPVYGNALIQKTDPDSGNPVSLTDSDLKFIKQMIGELDLNPRSKKQPWYYTFRFLDEQMARDFAQVFSQKYLVIGVNYGIDVNLPEEMEELDEEEVKIIEEEYWIEIITLELDDASFNDEAAVFGGEYLGCGHYFSKRVRNPDEIAHPNEGEIILMCPHVTFWADLTGGERQVFPHWLVLRERCRADEFLTKKQIKKLKVEPNELPSIKHLAMCDACYQLLESKKTGVSETQEHGSLLKVNWELGKYLRD